MDPRRRKAVVLATLPACMAGCIAPLTTHFHQSRYLPFLAVGLPVLMAVPLVLAIRELYRLKKDGNPY